MIRDPDMLLAVIAQMKAQFGTQLAELNDALAVANVVIGQQQQQIAEKDAKLAEHRNRPEQRCQSFGDAARENAASQQLQSANLSA
jgi:hypothetical protein